MKVEKFLGVPVDVIKMDDILTQVDTYIKQNKQMRIASVNPQIIVEIDKHPDVLDYINEASFRLPDGIGVVKASQMRQGEIDERLTGIDVMLALLEKANQRQDKIFLYGAKPEVVQKAASHIQSDYPQLEVAGYIDGYTQLTDDEIVQAINESGATFLFVALGFPKQEEWIYQNASALDVAVIEDVGGSLDVISGEVKRAPEWIQKMNLEWLYRSVTRPGRLDRLVQLPLFLWKVKRERV